MLVLAFGVVFAINSGLGVSSVTSLPFVISLVTGVNIGVCVAAIFTLSILIQVVILRNEFRYIDFTQIIFTFMFGYFVAFAQMLIGDFRIPTYAGQLVMLAISIILLTCGLTMYIEARLVNMPAEGLVASIAYKAGTAFHTIKMPLDCFIVTISVTLSFMFLGELHGIREGTILSALFVGRLMPVMKRLIMPVISAAGIKL